jgi:glycopeptide antibiotics resistance protein
MSRSQSSVVPWLLLAIIALIAYGSLYPFHFSFDDAHPSLLNAAKHLTWARAGRADQVRNVLLYAPLGFFLLLILRRSLGPTGSVIVATLLGAVLSFSIELAQVYVTMRVSSLMDVTLNTLGALLGAAGGVAWRSLSSLVYLPPNTRAQPGDRSALVVLITWLIWRLADFTPHVSLTRLKVALRPFLEFNFSLSLTLRFLLLWLVVAQATMSYAHRQRSNEVLLALIASVLVGRLLFVTPAFIPSELLALVLLLPTLIVLHKFRSVPQSAVVLLAFATLFVYERLAPFQFGSSQGHFDLWPFMTWIQHDMPIDADVLLRKAFIFGALVWLLKDVGLAMQTALIIVVATVLGIEVLHIWQPGKNGSLTDPALALCMGLIMRLASDERRRGKSISGSALKARR